MSWTLIEHQALTSSVASVTLGSGGTIPQTYKTLKLVVSARTDRASVPVDVIYVKPHNSTANGSTRRVDGNGTTAASNTGADLSGSGLTTGASATSNTFGSTEITFPNYSGSTNKPFSSDGVSETNATDGYQWLIAGLWSNTAAITSIVLASGTNNNFVSGSTFTLYGLA